MLQQARLKRKARKDEAKKAKKLRVTYDPDKVDSFEYREKIIRDSFHTTRSSHASSVFVTRQVFTPPPFVPKPSPHSPPSEPKINFTIPNPYPSSLSSPILNPTP